MSRHRRQIPSRAGLFRPGPTSWAVAALVAANLLMFVFFAGAMAVFGSHADALDDATVQSCTAAAQEAYGVWVGTDPIVEFDGAFRLLVTGNGSSVRCRYSIPAGDDELPGIEDVRMVRR